MIIFFLVFGIVCWQRKRLQNFFQKIENPKISDTLFILTGWLWAIFLESSLGLSPFHLRPIANYLIGLGFYLPYFVIWLALIKRYKFTFFEIFYLSGLGRFIFDLLITRKLITAAASTTYVLSALLVFFIQAIFIFILSGTLTILPVLYLRSPENKNHDKPLRHYLVGLTPSFLATGVFIVWVIILKIVFV